MKKKVIIAFCIILILAIIPRFFILFSDRPFTDEAGYGDLLVAKKIVVDHIFPLAGFNENYKWHIMKGPGWYYVLTIPFIVGGGNPIAAKIFTFIVQLGTISIAFFSLRKFFNLKTAFVTCFLLSISPWFIDQSASIWPPFLVPFFTVLFIVSLLRFLKGDKKFFLLMGLSLGIIGHFEIAVTFFLLAQVIIFLPFWLRQKLINIKLIIYSFLIFLSTMATVIVYDFTHNFYSSRGLLILFESLLKREEELNFMSKIIQRIDTFTWGFRSTFAPNIYVSTLIFIILAISAYFFLKGKENEIWKKRFVIFLLSIPLLKFIFSFFYPGVAMAWHYVDLIIVYCFLAGILISGLKILKLKYFSYFLLLILFLLFLNRNINVYRNGFYFSLSPDQIKQSIIVKYIFDNSMGKPFNFKVFSSSPLNRDFSYLFWYYGNQYKNQNFNKGKIIYLIKENKSINPSKKIEKGIVLKKFPEYTVEKLINLK